MIKNRISVHTLILYSLLWLARGSRVKNITYGVSRHIRSIGFPEGSGMGIFFALGIPVDIPDKSVLFSFYFEANYGLPGEWNSSYYENSEYFQKRSLDRRLTYNILQCKLESAGYSGKNCLLKTICEIARNPLIQNGVLGNILQIIFTPSSSKDEDLPSDVIEAEHARNCDEQYKDCPMSLLDLVSQYDVNVND